MKSHLISSELGTLLCLGHALVFFYYYNYHTSCCCMFWLLDRYGFEIL